MSEYVFSQASICELHSCKVNHQGLEISATRNKHLCSAHTVCFLTCIPFISDPHGAHTAVTVTVNDRTADLKLRRGLYRSTCARHRFLKGVSATPSGSFAYSRPVVAVIRRIQVYTRPSVLLEGLVSQRAGQEPLWF